MPVIGRAFLAAAALAAVPLAAHGQPRRKAPEPEGVKRLAVIKTDRGFVDDVYALDGAGGRVAVVRADAAAYAEIEIHDLAQGARSIARFDISELTTTPTSIDFVLDGNKLLVVGRREGDERRVAGLYDLEGKQLRKWGPARDIVLADVSGRQVAALFDTRATARGGTTYELAFHALDDGKLIKRRAFAANADGYVKGLDVKILYWRDGYTRLVGRKKGEYDRLKDQRMNDSEAVYEVVPGVFVRNTLPSDVVAWTKLVDLRRQRDNVPTFVVLDEQQNGLELVTADDKRLPVRLPARFYLYDPKSLRQEVGPGGRLYFSLTIDPVNPDAVDRKKADPEIIDLYVLEPGGPAARRLARLPKTDRPFSWRVGAGRWVVLRKHKAFSRGGTDLEVYDLLAK